MSPNRTRVSVCTFKIVDVCTLIGAIGSGAVGRAVSTIEGNRIESSKEARGGAEIAGMRASNSSSSEDTASVCKGLSH